jgi:uncharacterized RDD family membrane protein YckC
VTEAPRGFRDSGSKSRVLRAVIRVGVAGILVQLIVPVALMLATMPGLGLLGVRSIDPDRGAWWKGSLWLVETESGLFGGQSRESRLLRWSGAGNDDLEPMARFDGTDPWLLPGPGRLWIVSRDAVGWLGGHGFELARVAPASPVVSRPFLWQGRPALVGETPSGRSLFTFAERSWRSAGPLDLGDRDGEIGVEDIAVAGGDDGTTPWIVVRSAGGLRAAPGLPPCAGPEGCGGVFETALADDATGLHWVAAASGDGPLVVTARATSRRAELAGYRRTSGTWSRHFTVEIGLPGKVGAYPDDKNPGRVLVACQGFPGSLTVWDVVDGTVLGKTRLGETPFEAGWLSGWQLANYALSFLVPVLAVLLLAPVLERHRINTFRFDRGEVAAEFASLPRRGTAKAVDGLIVLLPLGPTAAPLLGSYLDVEQTIGESLHDLGTYFVVVFAWSVFCLLLFSFLESRSGRTPGKWMVGIRVVTADGGRVPLGRALLRNLLLVADGAFGFLVGIALIALTPRWQRLGDLVAKTLVVRG